MPHRKKKKTQAPPPETLRTRRLSEFTRREISWEWQRYLARGKITMLAGDPGLSKSMLTVDLAARVTRGAEWPDGASGTGRPGHVLLLSVEDSPDDTIEPRASYAGADLHKIHMVEAVDLEEWELACKTYERALYANRSYQRAATKFVRRQRHEPLPIGGDYWSYRHKILRVDSTEPKTVRDKILLIKAFVLREERKREKMQREVEQENMERVAHVSRERIPEHVRKFVWHRDKGHCVKCGSQKRLEFDHIIPVIEEGSSTARNVQLLCEVCNRSKGRAI